MPSKLSFRLTIKIANTLAGMALGSFGVASASRGAPAEELEGLVRIVGTEASSQVLITPETAFAGPHLCASPLTERLRTLESLVIHAKGSWQVPNVTEKCFAVASYSVLKTPSGHEALTGKLSQDKGLYRLAGDDGQTRTLGAVAPALQKLEGKKVIVDLRPLPRDTPQSPEAFRAVYYLELP